MNEDTPRTDAQLSSDHWNTYCLNEREGTEYVPAAFARELERELSEAIEKSVEREQWWNQTMIRAMAKMHEAVSYVAQFAKASK